MLEAVWAGHATPILHPFHALLRSAKKMAGTLIKTPKKSEIVMNTYGNYGEHDAYMIQL
jgi:hypothetical protein